MEWDWENLDVFNPKSCKKAYWGIGDIDGSFNLSGVVAGNNSSTKTSISESSFKEGMNVSFGCFPDSYNNKELDTSPVSSGEPFIGLKLGKRTYFDNSYAKSNNKTSSIPVSSMGKKLKSSCQTRPISHCQVEGCNLDLSSAKDYHRKHRVCETHSKSPKVIVAGVERRFCQQCSRFHSMSEFDDEKRSCRRRLSDHNARRRKPQHEPNSRSPYSSFYDTPLVQTNSKYSVVQMKAENFGGFGPSHSTGVAFTDALNRSVPSKGADLGFKEANVDAIDLGRALSLLSSNNNSWSSNSIPLGIQQHSASPSLPQHAIPSQDYWQAMDPVKTNNHFQEFQIYKSPYENSFLFHPNG